MTTFVHPGCNANHFLDAALDLNVEPSPEFATTLQLYGVQHIMSETSESELNDLSSDLPTDAHLVTFRFPDGVVSSDAVRAFTKCDIFDAYSDSGVSVIGIKSGFGSIRPKLYNAQTKEKK
jgi:hypothetical protein